MSVRELARLTGLHHTTLSRIEQGGGASGDTLRRIAHAFEVSTTDITRGDDVSEPRRKAPRQVPPPNTPEGEFFNYTPEEIAASGFLPWTARVIRNKASAYEIPHNGGGRGSRITFTGRQICEINAQLENRPLPPANKALAVA